MKMDKYIILLLSMLPYDRLIRLLIALFKDIAKKTENKVDDRIVKILEELVENNT
ncbi:MAG TPA: hypothetical protein PLH63_01810 [Candidatus Cloacimonadota bacterium]|nr:hypothetical protein [Candidatus Cloacimonadota bacterium]